jgi:hypothetical protein
MRVLNSLKRVLIGAGVASVVLSGQAAACMRADELAADQVRFIDMQLRVAALKCRTVNPAIIPLYNDFVRAHRPSIIASRQPVERYIARQTLMDMDDYVTRRANHLSFESLKVSGFCDNAAAIASFLTARPSPADALDLMPVGYVAPSAVCPVSPAQTTIIAENSRGAGPDSDQAAQSVTIQP